MSATTHVSKRVVLDDFRAGIFSDYHASASPVTPAPQSAVDARVNGAAVVDDTWGCMADRSGALVPAPRLTTGRTSARFPAVGTFAGSLPDTYLLDAIVVDEVQQEGQFQSQRPEVVTLTATTGDPNTDGFFDQYAVVRRWHEFKASPDTSDVMFVKCLASRGTNEIDLLSGSLTHARGMDDIDLLYAGGDLIRKGFAWAVHTLRSGANPTTGNPFVAGTVPAADAAITDWVTKYGTTFSGNFPPLLRDAVFGFFPNFGADPAFFPVGPGFVDGTAAPFNHWGAYMCIGHQARVVMACMVPGKYELKTDDYFAWKDRLSSTSLLTPQDFGGAGEFVEENTSLIGTMASLSADEMLVVKHSGGGYLLRGSVAAPTIVKLPFIESTGGIVSSPVTTPLGLVYGSRHGVFLWDGGETSTLLSAQLDGFFWNHLPPGSPITYQGHRARFGYWHPWVFTPNGFVFDTRHQSWWRIDDPDTHEAYSHYAVDGNGRLFAFPWRVTATSGDVWREATPGSATSQWSWKSQPIVETRDRAFKVRDLTVVATATDPSSTVTVTITGFDERGAATAIAAQTIALADNYDTPQMRMIDLPTTADALSYMQVRIEGATAGAGKAPKLHSLSLGLLDTNPIPKG